MSHAATTVFPKAVVADKTPDIVGQHGVGRGLLLRPQFALKRHVQQGLARIPFVSHVRLDVQIRREAAARPPNSHAANR